MKKKILIGVCALILLIIAGTRYLACASGSAEFPTNPLILLYLEMRQLKPDDIFEASEKGNIKRVAKLVKGKPELVNARNDAGWTPLYLATIGHHKELVEFLIAKGADVNAPAGVLDYRAIGAANIEIAKILLAHGADVNIRQIDGQTPLHTVSELTTELLITNGADVNARDMNGRTPLHVAVESELYNKKAEILIAHGADVNAADNTGMTPFHVAAKAGNLEAAKLLMQHGAKIEITDNQGSTSLHWAIYGCSQRNVIEGNLEIMKILIAKGQDIKVVDNDGDTPMHRAAACNCPEGVDILIEHGASVTVRNNSGNTPLHLTAGGIFAENALLVRKLIENGADVNAKNDLGETPLALAHKNNRLEVAEELKKHGAIE